MSEIETITEPTVTEPTVTVEAEETLGEGGVKALNAEREARKAAEKSTADLTKQLKAFEDRDKTEAQKQQEELEAARAELAALTTAKTRAEVAESKAVPSSLLSGPASSSEEDLAAFADALIAFRGEPAPTDRSRMIIPAEGGSPALPLNGDGLESALKSALGIF